MQAYCRRVGGSAVAYGINCIHYRKRRFGRSHDLAPMHRLPNCASSPVCRCSSFLYILPLLGHDHRRTQFGSRACSIDDHEMGIRQCGPMRPTPRRVVSFFCSRLSYLERRPVSAGINRSNAELPCTNPNNDASNEAVVSCSISFLAGSQSAYLEPIRPRRRCHLDLLLSPADPNARHALLQPHSATDPGQASSSSRGVWFDS